MAALVWTTAVFAFSSDSDPLFLALLGAAFGVFLFVKGFKDFQLKRLIQNTPNAKVRSAAIGLVEMQGISVGPYTIVSPVQQRPCFYYRTQLWRWVEREKDSEWVSVADERRHVPFYLKDNTGMVLVDPNGATFDIHRDYHQEFNNSLFSSGTPAPGAMAFVERYGLSSGTKVKLEEYTIRPDNPIFILGTLATNTGLRPCANPLITAGGSAVKVRGLSLDFSSGSNLLGSLAASGLSALTDGSSPVAVNINRQFTSIHVDKDGKATTVTGTTAGDAKAAETIKPGDPRAAAAVAAIAAKDPELAQKIALHLNVPCPPQANAPAPAKIGVSVTTQGSFPAGASAIVAAIAARDPALAAVVGGHLGIASAAAHPEPAAPAPGQWPDHDPTVIQKGSHDPHYYISWRSQKEVLSSLAWHSTLSIWGGPLLTLVCVWYLLGRFGML